MKSSDRPEALPKIVIDARVLGPVPHGFARYIAALAAGLQRISRDAPLTYEPIFLIKAGTSPRSLAGFKTCPVGAAFLSPLELVEIPRLLKRLGAAAYHSPTFSSLPVRMMPCPWIVTVHDLNHLKFGGFKEKLYYKKLLKPFIQYASKVATVSYFSRKEIVEWADVVEDEIEVVSNAIEPAFSERVPQVSIETVLAKYRLRRGRYFFSLSNTKPHKNLRMLVKAFSRRTSDWDLVLNLEEGQMPAIAGLHLIGAPSDEEARALMAGSGAVVFPSIYEGFGLPPVEAACLGVPIVVSRIPAHREALADLEQGEALYVDPLLSEGWTQALDRVTRGEVLGASVESRSRLLKRYSTTVLGASMDRIYQQVLGLGPRPDPS